MLENANVVGGCLCASVYIYFFLNTHKRKENIMLGHRGKQFKKFEPEAVTTAVIRLL